MKLSKGEVDIVIFLVWFWAVCLLFRAIREKIA